MAGLVNDMRYLVSDLGGSLKDYMEGLDALLAQHQTDTKAELDGIYQERNRCVAFAAYMALSAGWPVGLGKDDTMPTGWENVVFIDTPKGQLSWHIPQSELVWFQFLPEYQGQWDGHTTDQKYQRMFEQVYA